MSRYTQLTREQRYRIYILKKAVQTQTEIANTPGVHKSTISRELCRNRGGKGYRPKQAHKKLFGNSQSTAAVPEWRPAALRRGRGSLCAWGRRVVHYNP